MSLPSRQRGADHSLAFTRRSCPVRLVVPADRLDHYAGFFEPTWLTTDVETAIQEIREFMDMFVH